MSKQEEKGLVPELRFPEFRDQGEWGSFPLSEFVEALDAGVSVNSGDRPATSREVGILKTSCVTNGVFEPLENKIVFEGNEIDRLKEPVCGNTIIISRMNTPALVGANSYVKASIENLYLPDRLWAAKPKAGKSMRFIAFILGSGKGRAAISEMATGTSGSMKNITKPDVLGLKILAPSPPEQLKIADCLTSIDDLITAHTQKLDALKAHKKGLMQQLFPAEGETVSQLRFPEFRGKGEWVERKFGDLCFGISSGKDKSDPEGRIDLYGSTGVIGKITEQSYSGSYLLVARVGANAGLLTKADGKFGVTDNTLVIDLKDPEKIEFIYYRLLIFNLNKLIFGSGQPLVTGKQLKELLLYFPEREEQQKIADCLTSSDDLITAQVQKIDALKSHKKGLMQQLFPSHG